jgi:mono/diheme cytochrome c family protein
MRTRLAAVAMLAPVILAGCRATPPGRAETAIATAIKHHITIRDKHVRNPLPQNAATLADGKEAFGHYCVACHGKDGQNTGVPFAEHLSPPPPSLASQRVQGYTDGQLKWVINYGIQPSGMPGARGILSEDEQWSIVTYLRHLPPAGSQGTPEMYTH